MHRAGIERYMKTYPEGGHWKGKNYTFDRRMFQVPELKSAKKLTKEIESSCVVCHTTCDVYRGSFKCCHVWCNVPVRSLADFFNFQPCTLLALNEPSGTQVIVCQNCQETSPSEVQCDLCQQGHEAPMQDPDYSLLAKRRQESITSGDDAGAEGHKRKKRRGDATDASAKAQAAEACTRLFVGKLPLTCNATQIKESITAALGETAKDSVTHIHWIRDRASGAFYGSAFIGMESAGHAARVVEASTGTGVKLNGKKLKINLSPPPSDQPWPPTDYQFSERPPVM